MNVSEHHTFYYHADANALGGLLKHPVERVVSTHASVSLAHAGGFSSSRTAKSPDDDLIHFETAHAHVSGTEREGRGHESIATSTIEHLNILDVLTADKIVAQVAVMHPYDAPARISLLGTQFVNLRVNGSPLNPVLEPKMFGTADPADDTPVASDTPQFSDLLKVAETQYELGAKHRRSLIDKLGNRFALADPKTDLNEKGSVLCSLVQHVKPEVQVQNYGHMIHIPDFGNIFLGELCVSRFSAELTMLRIEMGCVAHGTVTAASARSNGRHMP